MIVYLPYAYTLGCVPPGRTVQHRYEVMGTAPFDVPEANGRVAPVSCALQDVPYRSFEGRSYRAVGMSLEALQERLADGDAKHADRRSKVAGLDVAMGHLFAGRFPVARSPFHRPLEAARIDALVKEAKRGKVVRDRSDDGQEARAEAAAAWRRGVLLVDGEPWMTAPEPRFVLEQHGRVIVLKAATGPSEGAKSSLGFRADHREEAVEYGRGLAAASHEGIFLDDAQGHADIAVASARRLTYDEAEGLAMSIYDEAGPGFLPSDNEAGLTDADIRRRRFDGDRTWAVDLLELPDVRTMIGRGGCVRRLAHEREAYVKACHVSLDAWTETFRGRFLKPVAVAEVEYVLSLGGP